MKICFACDLHLPFDKNAMQYDVLEWALGVIKKTAPDCICFVGDATCDGDIDNYNLFIKKMQSLNIPFIYIPGNSDLRNPAFKEKIINLTSPVMSVIHDTVIIAINDSDRTVSDDTKLILNGINSNAVVFMHHPIVELQKNSRIKLLEWRKSHPDIPLFYGHLHKSQIDGNDYSLGALDPDKSIGETPCLTFFDANTKSIDKEYYPAPMPSDFLDFLGISVFRLKEDFEFAISNEIKHLEFRPSLIDFDQDELINLVEKWRASGGKNLSVHLPDIEFKNGQVIPNKHLDHILELSKAIKANRFTQHVPVVSVSTVKNSPSILDQISSFLSEKLKDFSHNTVLGVENMHMTDGEIPDETRRFGYTPEECLFFMNKLKKVCPFTVGINFDIGHARNNSPYSQKYQISTWLSQLGRYAVGYHIHQVTLTDQGFSNHEPITEVYGHLISYASFFASWSKRQLAKAPLIMEMRPKNAYKTSLDAFNSARNK